MVDFDEITKKLQTCLPDAVVELVDLTGTGDHLKLHIVSEAFEGLRLVEQHRMVYDALEAELQGPIHALALETKTPAQAKNDS